MKCLQCGARLKTKRENYLYRESGLPNITLVGVEVNRCSSCGEYEVVIPKIEQLHHTIAAAVSRKEPRLTADEIRFLRKYLGWSGADFAAHIGVTAETVSRWESGSVAMGAVAERLLRLAALSQEPASDYSLDLLKQVAVKKQRSQRLNVTVRKGEWKAEAA